MSGIVLNITNFYQIIITTEKSCQILNIDEKL